MRGEWRIVFEPMGMTQAELAERMDQDTPSGEARTPLPPEEPEQMPERIGRYRIREELGRGGFAVVYLAVDPDLGRRVALKVPRRERFRDDGDLDGFIEEARNTVQLEHPRILRIHDVR